MDPLRVILVDDSALFRDGLAGLLAPAGIEVIGHASTSDEAMLRIGTQRPDVVVMDIRMPPTRTDEGLQAARQLKKDDPDQGVLLLSAHVEVASAARLFDEFSCGLGYLLKDRVDNVQALVRDLHRVAQGELVLDPEVIEGLFRRRKNARLLEGFSERERAVLQHMAEGRSNQGIAAEMHVAAKTVESYVASVFTKLGLPPSADDNRRVLAVLAWMRTRAG
ncbi:MAG: response regulator transcription factor [Actinomycetota bacterium]